MCTGGTLGEVPLVAEQVREELAAPLRGRLSPDDSQAARDGIARVSLAIFAPPAEPLILDAGTLWLRADE
jgi:hypothetical protein